MTHALRPLGIGLLFTWLFILACVMLRFGVGDVSCDVLAPLLCCYLFLANMTISLSLVRHNSNNLFWAPFWYTLAAGIFFGFGSLYIHWGDDYGRMQLDYVANLDSVALFEAHLLNIIGISIVQTTMFLGSYWVKATKTPYNVPKESLPQLKKFVLFFLLFGGSIKYLLVLPYAIGVTSFTLPGTLASLGFFYSAGLMVLAYLWMTEGGVWRYVFWVALAIDLPLSLLTLSKTALLTTVLFSVLGIFLARPRLQYLLLGGVGLLAFYIVIKPIVGQARALMSQRYSSSRLSLDYRAEIVQDTLAAGGLSEENDRGEGTIGWWKRLCYVPFHVFAINQYRDGVTFGSFKKIPFVFVPRFLYPEKPNMTSMGQDFNEMVFGYRSSSLGLGPFAESFWNGGYLGMLTACLYIGSLFVLLSFFSHQILHTKTWVFLPFTLQILDLARTPTVWFVPGYIGGVVIMAATATLVYVVYSILGGKVGEEKPQRAPRRAVRTWGRR